MFSTKGSSGPWTGTCALQHEPLTLHQRHMVKTCNSHLPPGRNHSRHFLVAQTEVGGVFSAPDIISVCIFGNKCPSDKKKALSTKIIEHYTGTFIFQSRIISWLIYIQEL